MGNEGGGRWEVGRDSTRGTEGFRCVPSGHRHWYGLSNCGAWWSEEMWTMDHNVDRGPFSHVHGLPSREWNGGALKLIH